MALSAVKVLTFSGRGSQCPTCFGDYIIPRRSMELMFWLVSGRSHELTGLVGLLVVVIANELYDAKLDVFGLGVNDTGFSQGQLAIVVEVSSFVLVGE